LNYSLKSREKDFIDRMISGIAAAKPTTPGTPPHGTFAPQAKTVG
jgi:hypothetical protein